MLNDALDRLRLITNHAAVSRGFADAGSEHCRPRLAAAVCLQQVLQCGAGEQRRIASEHDNRRVAKADATRVQIGDRDAHGMACARLRLLHHRQRPRCDLLHVCHHRFTTVPDDNDDVFGVKGCGGLQHVAKQ